MLLSVIRLFQSFIHLKKIIKEKSLIIQRISVNKRYPQPRYRYRVIFFFIVN